MPSISCSNQAKNNPGVAKHVVQPRQKNKGVSEKKPGKVSPGQPLSSDTYNIHVNPGDIEWMTLDNGLMVDPYTYKVLFKEDAAISLQESPI